MANFRDQLEEIKTLLSLNAKSHKPISYSTLLHLQEQSSSYPSSIQCLADSSHSLLNSILIDISDDDEEIAAQALKCLGFMIYHPSIVAAIPGHDANMIVGSLAKLITTTNIKSVCNLGVWCISIQQFNTPFLTAQFDSLLRAIVHALDNPIGSLSTTFEAIQAVMKLATQLCDKMRDTSNIWAPPIYRRLASTDKRERDIAERCLLKIRSTVCPPPSTLSKALLFDIKKKLLPAMKELLNQGMKIQTLKAWRWIMQLLGPYAMKNRQLLNEMLKILEQTFSDLNPQVQSASLVAWEGLIDALILPQIQSPQTNTDLEHAIQQARTPEGNNTEVEADGCSKRIKLIMTPLIGIMSSKSDVSVHSSCLNTWYYLLHKLNASIKHPSVIKSVWEPIFEVVFQAGPDSKNMCSWNFCLDLLDNFTLTRSKDVNDESNNQESVQLSGKTPIDGPPLSNKCLWKHCLVKWLPWDLDQLAFFMKMIQILISHGLTATATPEIKDLAYKAALRIFRSVLKGVQNVFKSSSSTYNEVMLGLNTILTFIKKICENVTVEESGINDLNHTLLQFVEAVTRELELSILSSPLYKVALDLKYIEHLESVSKLGNAKIPAICFPAYLDMVSPIVYLTILYFSVVVKSNLNAPEAESMVQGTYRYINFLFSSYNPSEILHAFVGLLHGHMVPHCLKIWIAVANCLKEYIECVKDLSLLKLESENPSYLIVCHLLSYPFTVSFVLQKRLTLIKTISSQELASVSSEQSMLELKHIIEAWKSLYVSINCASRSEFVSMSFSEHLSSILNGFLDDNRSMLESGIELYPREKNWDFDLLSFWGDVVIFVLEQILTSEVNSKRRLSKGDNSYRRSSHINNRLGFLARFMRLSKTKAEIKPQTGFAVTSRVFSMLVHFVGCLQLKEDILSFVEIISSPMLEWLSDNNLQNENINYQLQLLWTEILACLQMSSPPINFDSSFLKLQAPLLGRTLDHFNPSIADPTITFWNSTYGEQIKLDYPQSLLPVLDKLSRNGKINVCKRSLRFSEKSLSSLDIIRASQRYRVTAMPNRSSKRVELVKETLNHFLQNDKLPLGSKRKRPELTEHQKEVR